jgi:hypothetical protein
MTAEPAPMSEGMAEFCAWIAQAIAEELEAEQDDGVREEAAT